MQKFHKKHDDVHYISIVKILFIMMKMNVSMRNNHYNIRDVILYASF